PGKAMSPGKATRNAGGNPEGRSTLTAPGGAGHSEIAVPGAGVAAAAIANTNAPDSMQIHFIGLSFPRSSRHAMMMSRATFQTGRTSGSRCELLSEGISVTSSGVRAADQSFAFDSPPLQACLPAGQSLKLVVELAVRNSTAGWLTQKYPGIGPVIDAAVCFS